MFKYSHNQLPSTISQHLEFKLKHSNISQPLFNKLSLRKSWNNFSPKVSKTSWTRCLELLTKFNKALFITLHSFKESLTKTLISKYLHNWFQHAVGNYHWYLKSGSHCNFVVANFVFYFVFLVSVYWKGYICVSTPRMRPRATCTSNIRYTHIANTPLHVYGVKRGRSLLLVCVCMGNCLQPQTTP